MGFTARTSVGTVLADAADMPVPTVRDRTYSFVSLQCCARANAKKVESKLCMRFASRLATSVVCVACFGQLPSSAFQSPDYVTELDAYAVYAAILPSVWRGTDGLQLLQAETESIDRVVQCLDYVIPFEPEWEAVALAFKRENEHVRVLRTLLPLSVPYRLIARAEIRADDARLALKYPGTWQRRPESLDYAAVSSVGFNQDKSKAVVYVRERSGGNVYFMQFVGGEWVYPHLKRGCGGWVA
jgi:hypothetical protein